MKKLVVLVIALFALGGTLVAAHTANASSVFGGAGSAPSSAAAKGAEPGTVVQAYYRALNSKTVSLATPFLSDTIVLKVSQPYADGALEYTGIQAVQHYLEGDMRRIHSLTLQEMTVNGDSVEFTVAEWLDPRSVGFAGPFPAINRYLAIVRDGKIRSIVQRPLD